MPVNVLPRDSGGNTIAALRLLNPRAATFSSVNTVGPIATPIVRISADIDAWFAFGTNATATNTSHFLPAKLVEYVGIIPGDSFSVLSATGGSGVFYVSETI